MSVALARREPLTNIVAGKRMGWAYAGHWRRIYGRWSVVLETHFTRRPVDICHICERRWKRHGKKTFEDHMSRARARVGASS